MKRRHWLLGSGAVLAVGAGAAVGWRQLRAPARHDAAAAEQQLWAHSFSRTDGSALPMQSFRGKPLLLNFWATWCAPCISEMPLLDAFEARASRAGWNVLAIAIDSAEAVRAFVAAHQLQLPIGLAGADGLSLSRRLGNSFGGLPFTVVLSAGGAALHSHLGAVTAPILASWLPAD